VTGNLLALPIVLFVAHLSIGDTWNYVNNVEKRRGTAVAGVACVWASAVMVCRCYFGVSIQAGWTIFPLCVWLTIASALIYSIWDLNGRAEIIPTKQAV